MDFGELNKIVKSVKSLITLIPEEQMADNYANIEKLFNIIDNINEEIVKIKNQPKNIDTRINIANVVSEINVLKSAYNELVDKLNTK